ncbi:hypothetical protein O181_086179 [Austropuccinia psidii MF-1]|uniref:Uncharacterized protein n=1 Tax=Austropuccinia psidii MF-1 TaxID=1389203 RepID=A0A9Q3FWH5_9BASI|nr:hypothetical protein [Austropuccinia psidii MF-1]
MPIQHSPPARKTRAQVRTQAVLTPTPRAALYGTPPAPQLRAKLDRGPILEGEAPSKKEGRKRAKKIRGPGEDGEEEGSDGTEGVPAPVGASQCTEGPTIAQSNQPVSHQSEPSLLAIMQQMTQIMANHQAASSSEASRPPDLNTPSMKAPECFVGLNPSMLETSFILVNLFFIMIRKIPLKTERKFSMPPHFSLAGLRIGLSLIFPISSIKIQINFLIDGNCFNLNSSPYLGTQMK